MNNEKSIEDIIEDIVDILDKNTETVDNAVQDNTDKNDIENTVKVATIELPLAKNIIEELKEIESEIIEIIDTEVLDLVEEVEDFVEAGKPSKEIVLKDKGKEGKDDPSSLVLSLDYNLEKGAGSAPIIIKIADKSYDDEIIVQYEVELIPILDDSDNETVLDNNRTIEAEDTQEAQEAGEGSIVIYILLLLILLVIIVITVRHFNKKNR